jgi:hypothetical protein
MLVQGSESSKESSDASQDKLSLFCSRRLFRYQSPGAAVARAADAHGQVAWASQPSRGKRGFCRGRVRLEPVHGLTPSQLRQHARDLWSLPSPPSAGASFGKSFTGFGASIGRRKS